MNRFIQDDDGHWYLIPAGEYQEFIKWLDTEDDPDKFEKWRCEHPSQYEVEFVFET